MRKNGVFVLGSAGTVLRQFLFDFLYLGHGRRINAISPVLRFFFRQFSLQAIKIRRAGSCQAFVHFGFEAMLQIMVNLRRARIEDAINAEIQFRPVDLEYFFQLLNEVVVFAHGFLLWVVCKAIVFMSQ